MAFSKSSTQEEKRFQERIVYNPIEGFDLINSGFCNINVRGTNWLLPAWLMISFSL